MTRSLISEDPSAPGYDPKKLMLLQKATAAELFFRESRDVTWAAPMERRIESQHIADLTAIAPEVELASVECKSATCRVEVIADGPLGDNANIALQVLSHGDGASPGDSSQTDDGRTKHVMYQVFSEHRDVAKNETWYQKRRAAVLQDLAQAGLLLPLE